jgi:hypothetical protein
VLRAQESLGRIAARRRDGGGLSIFRAMRR